MVIAFNLQEKIGLEEGSVCGFFLIRIVRGGVQAGSTGHVGHWMACCTYPGWLWWWRILWNEDWQGKPKYSEKTCPSATLSTANPTWPHPGLNPGRRGGMPATNRLSYGAANREVAFQAHDPDRIHSRAHDTELFILKLSAPRTFPL
jgi:hypothetical protein